jgi:predicted DNA-binding WGR domain protein
MTAVTLTRTDHARRMARFYVLDVQPDLSAHKCFIREWGRIAQPGQLRQRPLPPPRTRLGKRLRVSAAPRSAEDTAARNRLDLSPLEHVSPIERDNAVLYGQYILDRKLVRQRPHRKGVLARCALRQTEATPWQLKLSTK